MKTILVGFTLALGLVTGANAFAVETLAGSDTLAGAITDAIVAAGMDQKISYIGGGSGNGEKGLTTGDQAIAPMSREVKPEAVAALAVLGLVAEPHVLALDGVSVFVNKSNKLASLDIATVARIYTCEFAKWEQIPGSKQTGPIKVYARNAASGTTDAFKAFTGLKAFGPCVIEVAETADVADITSRDVSAVGYSGLSGKVADNRSLAIAKTAGAVAVLPTTATIRNFTYPMARKLFVYEVKDAKTGATKATAEDQELLESILDRSFMDPIMQAHEFVTLD